ncbi:hypothetical protein BIW11_04403, partial [Tropilaelaps mercedesae]
MNIGVLSKSRYRQNYCSTRRSDILPVDCRANYVHVRHWWWTARSVQWEAWQGPFYRALQEASDRWCQRRPLTVQHNKLVTAPGAPELAKNFVLGGHTIATTATLVAEPLESVEEPLCGLCNLAERNPYLSSAFLSARVGPAKLGLSSDPEKPQKRRRIRTSKTSAEGNATCLEDICNVGVIPPGEEPLD